MTPNYEHYITIIECARLIPEFVSGNSLLAYGSTPERPREEENISFRDTGLAVAVGQYEAA